MQLDQIKTPFRWYQDPAFTTRNNPNCQRFKLITPKDRLLPFIIHFKTPDTDTTFPAHLTIYDADTDLVVYEVADNIAIDAIDYFRADGWDYLIYNGGQLAGLDMATGFYYAVLQMQDGTQFYSETFWVDCDDAGTVVEGNFAGDFNDDFSNDFLTAGILNSLKKYTKITWLHTCDIGDLIYQTGYANFLYLETAFVKKQAEYVDDGELDGEQNFFTTFSKITDNVTGSEYLPEYIINALEGIPIHEFVYVSMKNGYVGRIKNFKATYDFGTASDCSALTTLDFQMETIIKRGTCCENNQLTNLYECSGRISALQFSTAPDGTTGNTNVSIFWNVDSGAGPFRIVSQQVSAGAPHDTAATNYDLGAFAPGTQIDLTVYPVCAMPNGRQATGNKLSITIIVP